MPNAFFVDGPLAGKIRDIPMPLHVIIINLPPTPKGREQVTYMRAGWSKDHDLVLYDTKRNTPYKENPND